MESKFTYKIKKHIWICDYERLWVILSGLMVLSCYLMVRGSTGSLIWDNAVMRFLFVSDSNENKTLYNIAISYFAAYVFYILQIYIPERSKNRKALVATALETYNFTHQVDIFFFVWHQFVDTDLSEGVIKYTKIRKIYYNEVGEKAVFTSDREDLGKTVQRAKEEYEKVVNNPNFQKCDDKIMQLFLDKDIIRVINRLYQIMLSAEIMIKTKATIMETFSNEEIKDIQSIIKNIQKLYGFSEFKGFEITQDKKLINERDKMDKQMEKLILENLEYFHNLPKEYSESLH